MDSSLSQMSNRRNLFGIDLCSVCFVYHKKLALKTNQLLVPSAQQALQEMKFHNVQKCKCKTWGGRHKGICTGLFNESRQN